MLVAFSTHNWRTFRNEACLSMLAGRGRLHNRRLIRLDRFQTRLLPIALLFGKNGSGKTAFAEAMAGVRDLVLGQTSFETVQRLRHYPGHRVEGRTRMTFRIILERPRKAKACKEIFQYSIALDGSRISEEELQLMAPSSDKILFRRSKTGLSIPGPWPEGYDGEDSLRALARKTPPKQLVLANARDSGIGLCGQLLAWFERLHVYNGAGPYCAGDERLVGERLCADERGEWLAELSRALVDLDTGITELAWRETDYNSFRWEAGLPAEKLNPEVCDLEAGQTAWLGRHFALAFHQDRTLKVRILEARYGEELLSPHRFGAQAAYGYANDIWREPAGLRQLLGLMLLLSVAQGRERRGVIVVDGFGQGMHSMLAIGFLRRYLSYCGGGGKCPQLIACTHDSSLMRRELVRADEVWLCDRGPEGSRLYSVCEFKDVRSDTDISKSYLDGEFGAIPDCL